MDTRWINLYGRNNPEDIIDDLEIEVEKLQAELVEAENREADLIKDLKKALATRIGLLDRINSLLKLEKGKQCKK